MSKAFSDYIDKTEPNSVPHSLKKVLLKRIKPAVTAVVEEGYLDIDYSHSHYVQQGRAFVPPSRRTTRIHFFSSQVSKQHLERMSARTYKDLKQSYLGYTVIRPSKPQTLGRTFICPPENIDGEVAFFPTKSILEANLCGAVLPIEACPYLSQDQLVMACATASLWMSTTSISTKLTDVSQYTTSEITGLALSISRIYGPTIGGRGLRLEEMEHAFMAMGYDPILYEYPEAARLFDSSYIYLESGIPPVIIIDFPEYEIDGHRIEGLHAVTIVGHLLNTNKRRFNPIDIGIMSSAEFVPSLVVNDDQSGMYLRADVADVQDGGKHGERYKAKITIYMGNKELTGYCKCLMIPLPPRVLLPGEVALLSAASWLKEFAQPKGLIEPGELVLRPLLVRASKLKESLSTRKDISTQLAIVYRGLPMPRYVWMIEYGYFNDWVGHEAGDLRIQGELLLDPTSPARIAPRYICVHTPRLVAAARATKDDQSERRYYTIRRDHKYKPLSLGIRP